MGASQKVQTPAGDPVPVGMGAFALVPFQHWSAASFAEYRDPLASRLPGLPVEPLDRRQARIRRQVDRRGDALVYVPLDERLQTDAYAGIDLVGGDERLGKRSRGNGPFSFARWMLSSYAVSRMIPMRRSSNESDPSAP